MNNADNSSFEVATLGGGCFWCTEAVYDSLRGVVSVESGYAGGQTPNPTYQQVCSGRTGHAEVIQVTFDPAQISYGDLLEVFFATHDPTTLNRQGADAGTQYRSIILTHSPEQQRIAEDTIKKLTADGVYRDRIVTQIEPFTEFYPAEDYHQEYFANNATQPYCNIVIAPKVAKFRKSHAEMLKESSPAAT